MTPSGLLPSTRSTVSAFPLLRLGLSFWTTTIHISGLYDAACRLATPGSVPLLAKQHAGSLLSYWLGFAQVGLESHDSHPLGNTDLFHGFVLHSLDLGLRLARGTGWLGGIALVGGWHCALSHFPLLLPRKRPSCFRAHHGRARYNVPHFSTCPRSAATSLLGNPRIDVLTRPTDSGRP